MEQTIGLLKKNSLLIVILLAYFLLQLLFVTIGGLTLSDSEYIRIATEISEKGELYPTVSNFNFPYIWNIGAINLIALCLSIFNSFDSVLIVNCVANTLCALFLFLYVKRITNKNVGWICLILYSIYLPNFAYISSLQSETYFVLFIISGFYFSTFNNKYYNFLAGVLFVIANWFRPLLILFFPLLIFYFYQQKCLKRLLPISFGLVLTIFIIGGEVYSRTGKFVFQANTSWFNIAMTCNDSSDGTFNNELFQEEFILYQQNQDTKNCFDMTEVYKEKSLNYIFNNPVKMIKQIPNRFIRFYMNDTSCMWAFVPDKIHKTEHQLMDEGASSTLWTKFPNYGIYQYILLYSQLYYYFIIATFVLGAIKAYKNRYSQLLVPFLIVLFGTILTIAIISLNRYHYPFIPFMMIFSAYYISELNFVKRKFFNAKAS